MINEKQNEVLINKVSRLKDVYENFLIDKKINLKTTVFETKERYVYPPSEKFKAISLGDFWGEDFSYAWFSVDLKELENYKNEEWLLFSETDAVESVVFVNDEPYGMFDVVGGAPDSVFRLHKYLRLPKDCKKIDIEGYAGHAFVGTMPYETKHTFAQTAYKPHRVFGGISAVTYNKHVYDFIGNLYLLTSLLKSFDKDSFSRADLVAVYEQVFEAINMMPYDGLDIESVKNANAVLNSALKKDFNKENLPCIGMVGHSHLDTVWLWTKSETRRKLLATVSTAVRLLERYPDYKFMMSSVLYLEWIKNDYPALFNRIKALIQNGRFEINGGSFVECDCNLTGNESLCRQFIVGQNWLKKNIGEVSDCFWLPDTFGYSSALPQIIKNCKMDYFLTTKLSWNDTNKFPYETFYWKGLDGTKVLSHFNTIQTYAEPESVNKRANEIKRKDLSQRALLSYGFGDGGGGPDERMVEYAVKTKDLKGVVKCSHTTVSEFMNAVAADNFNYPVYSGELYLELHRGTLTTNHNIKDLNRRLEFLLHNCEFLTVQLGANKQSLKAETDEIYSTLLVNQFHDILPGTAITEAMMEAENENAAAIKKASSVIDKIIGDEVSKNTISAINCNSFSYNGFIYTNEGMFVSEENQTFIDFDDNEKVVNSVCLSPYSAKSFPLSKKCENNRSPFKLTFENENIKSVETDFYIIAFDENMSIVSLYDRLAKRETVSYKFNSFAIGENVPDKWDNWDIDADYVLKQSECNNLLNSEIVSNGVLQLRIRNTYKITDNSSLVQDMVLYPNEVRVDFESKLIWNDLHKILKVNFQADIVSDFIKSETQFGYITRSTLNNTSLNQAQFEFCNHKWSDLAENDYGIALLNNNKYGISCKDGVIGLTLQTSGNHPDIRADKGTHYFNYSIICHNCHFTCESVISKAYSLNNLPLIFNERKIDFESFAYSTDCGVIIETVKTAEDGGGYVLRLFESQGNHCCTEIVFNDSYNIYETNILEDTKKLLALNTQKVELSFKPFEIKTLFITKN